VVGNPANGAETALRRPRAAGNPANLLRAGNKRQRSETLSRIGHDSCPFSE